jgi:hypothetical protein
MWKAIIKLKSSVDAGQQAEYTYDVTVDGEVKYPNLKVICIPENLQDLVATRVRELKSQVEKNEEIELPMEIEI